MKSFAALVALTVLASTGIAQSEDVALGFRMQHEIVFKQPLVIPDATLGENSKLKARIETSRAQQTSDFIAIVMVDGEVIQTNDMFDRANRDVVRNFEVVAKKREQSMPLGMSDEDLSFCVLYIDAAKLLRDEAGARYHFLPRKEMLPFTEPGQKLDIKAFRVNGGIFTEEQFGMFVELKPSERPNPITHRGRSSEIPTLTCYRYAEKNRGLRAKDFVQILGKENVELRIK